MRLQIIPVCILILSVCLATAKAQDPNKLDRGAIGPVFRSLNFTNHGYEIVEDFTGKALHAKIERFEVRPGDCGEAYGWSDCQNDRERSELSQKNKEDKQGRTEWYSWSLYVPADYKNIYPTKVALGQFYQHGSHPVWVFQNGQGGYFLDNQVTGSTSRTYLLIEKEAVRGRWWTVKVNVRWTTDETGFFKVWINDELKVNYTGPTYSGYKIYFKYGLYRSFLSRFKRKTGLSEVPGQTVYYSDVKSGPTETSIK